MRKKAQPKSVPYHLIEECSEVGAPMYALLRRLVHEHQDGPVADHAGRLWSLWDVMHKFRAPELMYGLKQLEEHRAYCSRLQLVAGGGNKPTDEFFADVKRTLQQLEELCKSAAFDAARSKASLTQTHYENTSLDYIQIATLEADLRNLEDMIFSDVFRGRYLFVPRERVPFLEASTLFGDAVAKAFPSAKSDLIEAGNCLAADCNTAAVFHLMRVTEWGLRALAVHLGFKRLKSRIKKTGKVSYTSLAYTEWEKILDQLQVRVDERSAKLKRSSAKQQFQEFYYPILQDIRALRDAWRNHVMHTRQSYAAPDADAVLVHVKRLMETLATGSLP